MKAHAFITFYLFRRVAKTLHQRLVHIIVHTLALVVLKVGERRCLYTNIEAPALVVAEWNPLERHLPAVQVARYGY